jgi:hypothetical protein
MNVQKRMSPFTALFLGIFGVGALTIAGASCIVLFGMRIADNRITDVLHLADDTIDGLPDLINSLPPAIGDVLNDRRAPQYAADLDVDVAFAMDESGRLRPVMTIKNNGSEVVSMLAVRVAALLDNGMPVREWTEVVATPIAIENEWRGPLMPNATRHVVLSRCYGHAGKILGNLTPAYEISEVRVWQQSDTSG